MAKIVFVDEEGQNLNRYQLVPVDGQPNIFDLVRMANITKQGTPIYKATLDRLVQDEDLTAHTGNKSNPHEVTKAQLGLSNVNNTADAEKSVSYANDAGTVSGKRFNWNGQGGQPNWLWGGNNSDPSNMYVYDPHNFTVADTASINSALTLSTAAPSYTLAAGKLYGVY